MKVIFEYDPSSGAITDSTGMFINMLGMIGFEPESPASLVLDLVKQGVTPDEIIKLKNNDLL